MDGTLRGGAGDGQSLVQADQRRDARDARVRHASPARPRRSSRPPGRDGRLGPQHFAAQEGFRTADHQRLAGISGSSHYGDASRRVIAPPAHSRRWGALRSGMWWCAHTVEGQRQRDSLDHAFRSHCIHQALTSRRRADKYDIANPRGLTTCGRGGISVEARRPAHTCSCRRPLPDDTLLEGGETSCSACSQTVRDAIDCPMAAAQTSVGFAAARLDSAVFATSPTSSKRQRRDGDRFNPCSGGSSPRGRARWWTGSSSDSCTMALTNG